MREELLDGLTDEQIAKIKDCKTTEEMLALAKEEGIELTDEQLEAVNGGCGTVEMVGRTCPRCGNGELRRTAPTMFKDAKYECLKCGFKGTGVAGGDIVED